MTQGTLKTYFSNQAAPTGNAASFSATGSTVVAVGDLICVTGLISFYGVTWSDNLGNTYTNLDAQGRRAFTRVTTGGTLTTVSMTWGFLISPNAAMIAAVFNGPYDVSPKDVDKTPVANFSAPYTAPASGTLAKATETVVAGFYYDSPNGSSLAADSPFTLIAQADASTSLGVAMSYLKANDTSSVTPSFSNNIGANGYIGTASFKFTPRRRGLNCTST